MRRATFSATAAVAGAAGRDLPAVGSGDEDIVMAGSNDEGGTRPFRGALRGVTWNAQALFSTDPDRFEAKQRVMEELAKDHDFVMVQETHSTMGALAAWRQPTG
jgi:hypothetical protein